MNDPDRLLLAGTAKRAEARRFFVASALAAYRVLAEIDEARLATWLGIGGDALPRLALCRRPNGDSSMFADDVQRIAAFVGADPGRLAALLRAVENAEAMQPPSSATLLAAQDREPPQGRTVLQDGTAQDSEPSA